MLHQFAIISTQQNKSESFDQAFNFEFPASFRLVWCEYTFNHLFQLVSTVPLAIRIFVLVIFHWCIDVLIRFPASNRSIIIIVQRQSAHSNYVGL
jgi:hypothetical protein